MSLDLSRYEDIDWDDEDAPNSNLAHCARVGRLAPNPERTVSEVLTEAPVEAKMALDTAEFAVVGPDSSWSRWWVVLLDTSYKRGDWLRPVTGWPAERAEKQTWEQSQGGRR